MTSDQAYIFGLIVGGGVFGSNECMFRIKLPYRKWGSFLEAPQRAMQISQDILKKVGGMFQSLYGITIQYEATDSVWSILCEGYLDKLKEDLANCGIKCEGEIRENADISGIVEQLTDDNLKRRFVAGLADTIGSMSRSHRRFTDEHQTLSFEINGFNFRFVCDLCKLLYSINCIPDQVNWNHPNIHCTNDAYYEQWHKGFKIRILLDQYAKFGAFAFRTKAESAAENRKLQKNQHTAEICETRTIHITPSCIHPAENDERLPEIIRGGHYCHFRHFCAVLGCEHAPYQQIDRVLSDMADKIMPFTISTKNDIKTIRTIIDETPLFKNRKYKHIRYSVSSLLEKYKGNKSYLLFGDTKRTGYPINEIIQAVAYVIADANELFGKRVRGNFIQVVEKHIKNNPDLYVEMDIPDLLTPLIVSLNNRACLIGPENPDVYKKLISFDSVNKYKLYVREITEEDLIV